MKLNGRFFPFEEDRKENDPDQDFPIQETVNDFAGKERHFEIKYHDAGLGFIVDAYEKVKGEGYHFSAFDTTSPYIALGKLRDKMRRRLSTRHIYKEKGRYYPSHDTIRGRITSSDGSDVIFVVDGIPLSLQQLGKMANMYEGWEFTFRFIDHAEDD